MRSGTTWSQQAKITASDAAAFDLFGESAFISGDFAVVGAQGDDDAGSNSGSAYVFEFVEPLPHAFVLLADKKIKIHGQVLSEGDIHSNDKIDFKKGNPSTHTGNLTAVRDIKIDKDNTIDGDATAGGKLDLKGNANVTDMVTENAVVLPVPLPILSFTAGGADVKVDKNQIQSLSPGSYGKVKVEISQKRGDKE